MSLGVAQFAAFEMHGHDLGQEQQVIPQGQLVPHTDLNHDADGELDARAILTYSQSPEPGSAHYSDMTELYSRGEWLQLPFTDAQIEADPELRMLSLSE